MAETEVETRYGWLGLRPKALQVVNNTWCFLFFISCAGFMQGLVVSGLTNISLTSIETRFGVSTTAVSVIPISYDIASILVVIPISYYGGRTSQTRTVGVGMLVMALGMFVMGFVPHFATVSRGSPMDDLKAVGGASLGLCRESGDGGVQNSSAENLRGWVAVFYLGMVLLGFGAAPLWANTFDYLDKNLKHENFPLFSAVFTLSGIIGPGFGYLIGGYFLTLPFDDIDKSDEFYADMSDSEYQKLQEDPSFIGAWWIGFLIGCAGMFIFSFPVLGFPYEFPKSAELRQHRTVEAYGQVSAAEDVKPIRDMSLQDFKMGMKYFFTNPVLVCIAFAGAMEGFYLSIISSFGQKYLETVFNMTASNASFTMGAILLPSSILALIAGGLIPKVCKFSIVQLLALCASAALVSFLATFLILIGCGQADLIKPDDVISYRSLTCDVTSCNCSPALYKPSCLDKTTNLFSPCYYGCTEAGNISSCSCFDQSVNSNLEDDLCETGQFCDSWKLVVVLTSYTLICFTVFFNVPAGESALDRSCLPQYRSLAFGLDICIMRVFGTVPGPVIAGAVFDSQCQLWQTTSTGDRGSCLSYDQSVSTGYTVLILISSGMMTLSFCIALYFAFSDSQSKVGDDMKEGQRKSPLFDNPAITPEGVSQRSNQHSEKKADHENGGTVNPSYKEYQF